jgi:AraC-like DNA-binding protein
MRCTGIVKSCQTEGTSFERVLDELRYELALQYLGEKVSVGETAYLLGYSDRATFSRAFKRWSNFSPRALPSKIENGHAIAAGVGVFYG